MEMTLALIGLSVFVYVVLQVWRWVNVMIVERQRVFQESRLAAGQPQTAGAPVAFNPKEHPLRLIGELIPPSSGSAIGPLRQPPCAAAKSKYDQAKAEQAEAIKLVAGPGGILELAAQIGKDAQELCATATVQIDACSAIARTPLLDAAQQDDPAVVQHALNEVIRPRVRACLDARIGPCVGVGRPSDRVPGNWTRCAKFWFEAAAGEDDDDDREDYLREAAVCQSHVNRLGAHIKTLGDQIKALQARVKQHSEKAKQLVREGDAACP